MDNATLQRVRKYLTRARDELDFVEQNPEMCCDACGPYGHTFHASRDAAERAIRAFLCFHHCEPEETHDPKRFAETHDLRRLVTLAAAVLSSFESCMDAATGLMRNHSRDQEPSRSELVEALHLAEHLVSFAVDPPRNGYTNARTRQFYQTLRARLLATPGVHDAAADGGVVLAHATATRAVAA